MEKETIKVENRRELFRIVGNIFNYFLLESKKEKASKG